MLLRTISCALLLVASVSVLPFCRSSRENSNVVKKTYTNPVFDRDFPDPNLIQSPDGFYYAYSTQANWSKQNLGGPYITPILRSRNLVDWEFVGDAFTKKPDWKPAGGIWAPDAVYYKGKYILYYSFSTWGDPDAGIGVASSDGPGGPFTDHGKLFLSKEQGVHNSIDAVFFEDGGKPYLVWGSFHGIYGIPLSDDGLTLAGEKFQIAGNDFEGSYFYRRDGYIYYFGSVGTCCEGATSTYRVKVGRSKDFRGPYLDKEGRNLMEKGSGTLILEGNKGEQGFAGPGHNGDIISDNKGETWMLYHGFHKKDPKKGRVMLLDKILWSDGWPSMANGEPSLAETTAPVF